MNDQLELDRGLPANPEAERTILGAVLLDNDFLAEAEEKLRPEDFSLDSHRRIFLRMRDLSRSGHSVDIVTLASELTRNKETSSIGGVSYLASLTEGLPRRPKISEYIRIVREKSMLRRLMAICNSSIARAADESEAAETIIAELSASLEDVVMASSGSVEIESVGAWISANDVFAEKSWGIKTGIDGYDEFTFGLHPGELSVFAGRTSMGKTAFAGTLAPNVARQGKAVAVFINEQAKQSFIGRMICSVSLASFKDFRRGTLGVWERDYAERARDEIRQLPIFWDQRSSMSIASIRAKSTRLKRSGELDLIVVDQLSRVSGEGIWVKGMRSDEVIGEKVSGLKAIAVDLGVPLVLLHQVGRSATKNAEGRPNLSDLAESGKIEQHADNVAFFHRPKYFDRNSEAPDEIILAKQRDGETGIVECEFVGACCRWQNKGRK